MPERAPAGECDVLVIGSGAGGLTTAVTAARTGLDVLVVEKAGYFGGTTAISGGWLWIPNSRVAQRAGFEDSRDEVLTYLHGELGQHTDDARIAAFLDNGPVMVDFLEQQAGIPFIAGPFPDYHPGAPGAAAAGRALAALPMRGMALGELAARLRPPIREQTLLGMRIGGGAVELMHFFNATRSIRSARYVLARMASYLLDVMRYGHDMRFVNGGALAARLAHAMTQAGARLWLDAPAKELILDRGRVAGAVVQREGKNVRVLARRGVVLASGGFPHDIARRQRMYPHAPTASGHFSVAPAENTGDGARMAESVGAKVVDSYDNAAAWYPVSLIPQRDGTSRVFPHSIDRAKPGIIAVTPDGKRFVNESDSYYDFTLAMLNTRKHGLPGTAFLVCDHRAIRRYGIGAVKPFPFPIESFIRSGYLLRGNTVGELADATGMPRAALEQTIARFNANAAQGNDPDLQRGSNAYHRIQGDPGHAPNPTLAPLDRAPYYAVKVLPGDLGTFAGICTDAAGCVLREDGSAIPGLFATGNDMASIFGGYYPGAGITLGPAMTFGYIIGKKLCESS